MRISKLKNILNDVQSKYGDIKINFEVGIGIDFFIEESPTILAERDIKTKEVILKFGSCGASLFPIHKIDSIENDYFEYEYPIELFAFENFDNRKRLILKAKENIEKIKKYFKEK